MTRELIHTVGKYVVYWNDDGSYTITTRGETDWAAVEVNYSGGDAEKLAIAIAELRDVRTDN